MATVDVARNANELNSSKMGYINEPHNIIGLSHLMKDDANPDINIEELEKNIINGERDIQSEEIDLVSQYKSDMQRLSKKFGVSLSGDDSNRDPAGEFARAQDTYATSSSIWGENNQTFVSSNDRAMSNDQQFPSIQREPSIRYDQPHERPLEGLKLGDLSNYKFASYEKDNNYNPYTPRMDTNNNFKDPYLHNMTQEQQKRIHLKQVFNNISSRDRASMDNYDLMADREHEDKQLLLSEIEELREDLQQIGVDISRVKEVDNNSSISDIQKVHRKLIYKNNSNNYGEFADEIFILGAQTAEYLFDGEKEWWFGHKPDLTGWTNTVRGKLRRMRYTKTKIVRKIVDDYQIPDWLQIGIEIVPSAFTHSRHRKSAVKDSVVNNATYQNAIHDLNSIVN